jgi:surface antigen
MHLRILIITLASAMLASGCAGINTSSKEDIGQQVGMVAGGVVGAVIPVNKKYKEITVVGGAIGGMWLGGQLGKQLDDQDKEKVAQAAQAALQSGRKQSWSNASKKTSGTAEVIPDRTKTAKSDCKTVRTVVTLANGQLTSEDHAACPNGSGWNIQ